MITINDLSAMRKLFHNLTPTTLAAIAADLDGNNDYGLSRTRELAIASGDELNGYLDEARAERDNGHRGNGDHGNEMLLAEEDDGDEYDDYMTSLHSFANSKG